MSKHSTLLFGAALLFGLAAAIALIAGRPVLPMPFIMAASALALVGLRVRERER